MPLTFDRAEFELQSDLTGRADLWWCEVRLFLRDAATDHFHQAMLRMTVPVGRDTTVDEASRAAQAAAIPLLEAALSVLRTQDPATLDHQRRTEAEEAGASVRRMMGEG